MFGLSWLTSLCLGTGACKCKAGSHPGRFVFLDRAVVPRSEYPCCVSQPRWRRHLSRDVALRCLCMGWGGRGVQAANGKGSRDPPSSLSYSQQQTLVSLGIAVASHHATEHSWGDTSPSPHRALGMRAGADRFVTGTAFLCALSLNNLASSATS